MLNLRVKGLNIYTRTILEVVIVSMDTLYDWLTIWLGQSKTILLCEIRIRKRRAVGVYKG